MRSRWITGGNSCTIIYQKCGDACGEHKPEKEKPVQARELSDRQIRLTRRCGDAERTVVVKHADLVPRKAAIAYMTPVP